MNKILQQLCRIGIVPVVSVEDAGKAVGLANALAAGGIPAAEVTFRTQAGEEASAIAEIAAGIGGGWHNSECGAMPAGIVPPAPSSLSLPGTTKILYPTAWVWVYR